MRALLSVHDKTGVVDFARGLVALGYELLSTGGTHRALAEAAVPVAEIAQVTGFPEILGGRVKTLHPSVHGGILARRDLPEHLAELERHGIAAIDLVAVNLYPFARALERPEATHAELVEEIDIGGPAMLRAAAKNHAHVAAVVDPGDYDRVLDLLRRGALGEAERRSLAARAFQHVAAYDTLVAGYLRGPDAELPDDLTLALRKVQELRYGENPHQRAAFYAQAPTVGVAGTIAGARQLHGKQLSYCNVLDLDAALAAARDFSGPAVAIVKHATPCGLATADTLLEAYRLALAGDPVSAFGGAVALNRPVDRATAEAIAETFFDDLVAPAFDEDALAVLTKKKNLRICVVEAAAPAPELARRAPTARLEVRRVSGGFLLQTPDAVAEDEVVLRTASRREPTPEELRDLLFAWRAVKHVKSNAIVLAKSGALVGVGAGQVSRVDAVDLAVRKSGGRQAGAVLASDAYFPFPDGPEIAARAGVTAIIQPGGSLRDAEVVRVVDEHGLAMVFTGTRHFRH